MGELSVSSKVVPKLFMLACPPPGTKATAEGGRHADRSKGAGATAAVGGGNMATVGSRCHDRSEAEHSQVEHPFHPQALPNTP